MGSVCCFLLVCATLCHWLLLWCAVQALNMRVTFLISDHFFVIISLIIMDNYFTLTLKRTSGNFLFENERICAKSFCFWQALQSLCLDWRKETRLNRWKEFYTQYSQYRCPVVHLKPSERHCRTHSFNAHSVSIALSCISDCNLVLFCFSQWTFSERSAQPIDLHIDLPH